MKAQETDELVAFHAFVTKKLKKGGPKPSPEQAVREWRNLQAEPEIDEEELAAIQEAIDDMKNGDRGRPIDEVIAELRAKYGIPKGNPRSRQSTRRQK